MSATITTSTVTGGTNSHATTSAEAGGFATDFGSAGVVGALTNTSGVAPSTGSFAVNAQGTPAMFVDVSAGTAWITATPSGQTSQLLRAYMASNYTSYAITANASGSTKYDWIYLQVDATAANNPASDASDVTSLVTSRSTSNTADTGSPPTYGIPLAIVTVANGATSISNSSIKDNRTRVSQSPLASMGSITTTQLSSTGNLSISGVGFKPKIVKFTSIPASNSGAHTYATGGMTTSYQYYAAASGTTAGAFRNSSTTSCLGYLPSGSATPTILASYVSMDTDGFTINVATASNASAFVWEAWG